MRTGSFRIFLLVLLAAQAIAILAGVFTPFGYWFSKTISLEAVTTVVTETNLLEPVLMSVALALIAGFLASAFAFVASWWLWRYKMNDTIRRTIELSLKVPYLLPAFFFAMGWIALAAPNVGYYSQIFMFFGLPQPPSIYGFWGIVLVEVFWTSALAMIQLQSFFHNSSTVLEDAALLCGARPWQAFVKITLPIARKQIAACVLLTMASSIAAFGVPAMLGLPARTYLVTTKIYQGIKSSSDFSEVSALALILMFITALLVFSYIQMARRDKTMYLVGGKAAGTNRIKPTTGSRGLGIFVAAMCVVGTLAPLSAVLIQSLLSDRGDLASWSLEKYFYVFGSVPDGFDAAKNSFFISLATALLLTTVGFFTAYSRTRSSGIARTAATTVSAAWSFAYATPGTVIALPILVFFQSSLANTLWIIGLAFAVKYAAFAIRTLEPAIAQISRDLEEAAWISGATPAQTFFRIVTPLCLPALSAAFALCFIPMLSELTMSIFLVGAGTETLGTLIYRFQEYADPGAASVLAVAVAAFTFLANLSLKRVSRGRFGI